MHYRQHDELAHHIVMPRPPINIAIHIPRVVRAPLATRFDHDLNHMNDQEQVLLHQPTTTQCATATTNAANATNATTTALVLSTTPRRLAVGTTITSTTTTTTTRTPASTYFVATAEPFDEAKLERHEL